MTIKDFVRGYLDRHATGMPDPWVAEVLRIVEGKTAYDSADARGVTRDAVKAQRKKIFKKLGVPNSYDLLVNMLGDAVKRLPATK